MLKKFLWARQKSLGIAKSKFASKTAKSLLFIVVIVAVFLFAQAVMAQTDTYGLNTVGSVIQLPTTDIRVTIARIINAALGLLGLVAITIIIYGGYLWMTARGEVEKIQKAKKVLIEAVIGLIIILTSFAIANLIFFILGINPWGGNVPSGPGGPNYGGGGGALGAGIIQSHYPARNAKNIPRNTKIAITFKEPICLTDLANVAASGFCANNGNVACQTDVDCPQSTCVKTNKINTNTIKIYIQPQANAQPAPITDVNAYHTDDLKTFVFQPVEYLGNSNTNTVYTVELTSNLKKGNCATSAFGAFGGYKWSFTVSTVLDLTPPQIESVIPVALATPSSANAVPRNSVIQINFNEAIDPTTLAGKTQVAGGKVGALLPGSYDLIGVKTGDNYVAGEFYFSNEYRTVEFITNDPCGKNSCGDQVYCLPSSSAISVLIKAANLIAAPKPTAAFPYDGLVDMASNSLDGNQDTLSQGQTALTAPYYSLNDKSGTPDSATWQFFTNDKIDLIPPQVSTRDPNNSATNVDSKSNLALFFDKNLLFSSLVQAASLTLDQTLDQPPIPPANVSGYWLVKNTDNGVTIKTTGLALNHDYNIIANQGIKDLTQNCFMPCADIGNCTRVETATPGQYTKSPTNWIGAYPSCNLAP